MKFPPKSISNNYHQHKQGFTISWPSSSDQNAQKASPDASKLSPLNYKQEEGRVMDRAYEKQDSRPNGDHHSELLLPHIQSPVKRKRIQSSHRTPPCKIQPRYTDFVLSRQGPHKTASFPPHSLSPTGLQSKATSSLHAFTQSLNAMGTSPSTSKQRLGLSGVDLSPSTSRKEKVLTTHACNVWTDEENRLHIKCDSDSEDMVLAKGCRMWGNHDGTMAIVYESSDDDSISENLDSYSDTQRSSSTQTESSKEVAWRLDRTGYPIVQMLKEKRISACHGFLSEKVEGATSSTIDKENGNDENGGQLPEKAKGEMTYLETEHNDLKSNQNKSQAETIDTDFSKNQSSNAPNSNIFSNQHCDKKEQSVLQQENKNSRLAIDPRPCVHVSGTDSTKIEFHDVSHGKLMNKKRSADALKAQKMSSTKPLLQQWKATEDMVKHTLDIPFEEETTKQSSFTVSTNRLTSDEHSSSDEEDQPYLTPRPETSYHTFTESVQKHENRSPESLSDHTSSKKRKVSLSELHANEPGSERNEETAQSSGSVKKRFSVHKGDMLKLASHFLPITSKGVEVMVQRDEMTDSTKPPSISELTDQSSGGDNQLSEASPMEETDADIQTFDDMKFAGPAKMKMRVYKNGFGEPVWELSILFK